MYFGRERVETGPSCLHELATFLKYHMPLILSCFPFFFVLIPPK